MTPDPLEIASYPHPVSYTSRTGANVPGLKGSSLFLVKDLASIGGLLHRRSTLDLGSVIIMAHDPGAVVKCFRAQFNVITLDLVKLEANHYASCSDLK